jgi:O-antigen ligase
VSFEPREDRTTPLSEARGAAEEQARQLPAGLVVLGGSVLALAAVLLFVILDYRFDQAPHRLLKILLGASMIVSIVVKPRVGLWLFALATPFLAWMPQLGIPAVNPLNVLLFSITVSFALSRIIQRKQVFRAGTMGPPLLALVVLMGLSVLRGAAYPATPGYDAASSGLWVFRSAVTLLGYFVTLMMVRGERDRKVFGYAIVVALLLESLVTINNGRDGSGGRALGSLMQSNELGTFLAMYVVVAAALVPAVKRRWAQVLMLGATVTGMIGVFLSVSRGALVGVGNGLLFVGLRTSRWMAVLTLLTMLTSPLWIPDYMMERLNETEVAVEGSDVTELEGSAQARIDTWRAMTEIIAEHPLDGIGFHGLRYALPEMGDDLGLEVKDSSHNTYLRFQAEMGILGLVVLLVVFWKCFSIAMDGIRYSKAPFDRQLSIGLGASTMVIAISCAFGDRFFPVTVVGNFWMLCALVDTLRLERREKSA